MAKNKKFRRAPCPTPPPSKSQPRIAPQFWRGAYPPPQRKRSCPCHYAPVLPSLRLCPLNLKISIMRPSRRVRSWRGGALGGPGGWSKKCGKQPVAIRGACRPFRDFHHLRLTPPVHNATVHGPLQNTGPHVSSALRLFLVGKPV